MCLCLKFPPVVVMKHIIHLEGFIYNYLFVLLFYCVKMFDDEYIHETCLDEEVCNIMNLVENIIGHQLLGQ